MADENQLRRLREGVESWNDWRRGQAQPVRLDGADLQGLDLREADLRQADLAGADLRGAHLSAADLRDATLDHARLSEIDLLRADLTGARMERVDLSAADLAWTILEGAILRRSNLSEAKLRQARLAGADLSGAHLFQAELAGSDLSGADLSGADLTEANLYRANLKGAVLRGANLRVASLVKADLGGATIDGCIIYGVSAWDVNLDDTRQSNLVISQPGEPTITVDNLEMGQFVYLLLRNEKIRDVIDTIGSRGVLVLGRFGERMPVLDSIRAALRQRGYLPIVFDFERPTNRDFSETVLTLAGLSRFIIADITSPRAVPQELQLAVPNYSIPLVPLLQRGEQPYSMFQDLWTKYGNWVLEPVRYDSIDDLLERFDDEVLQQADATRDRLIEMKARKLVAGDGG